MTELEKLRVLLPHWITHNREHGVEFVRWAEALEKEGSGEIAEALREAVAAAEEVTARLEHSLALAGGPLEGPSGHAHSHEGHDHTHTHHHHHDHDGHHEH